MPEDKTSKKEGDTKDEEAKNQLQAEDDMTEEKKDAKEEQKEEPSVSDAGKKKIMIVEDEHPLAHALELKLSREGFATQIVNNGTQALEKTKEYKPDMILLDLIMPQMDGFTFLEELKKEDSKADVIVLSNLGQDEDRKRAEEYGVKGYFVKANTPITDIVKNVINLL